VDADALVIEFEVGVTPPEAFETWTRRCATWWPRSHTVSGDPAAIVFEPFAGGRILERARDGTEYDWGSVIDWQPPTRLRYRWHLFFDPSEATEVDVLFTARGAETAVRLEQSGWERLGAQGPPRRAKTAQAWSALTATFARALAPA
jgi:Activator of Hsp90 ATPase homolog 1-like protein